MTLRDTTRHILNSNEPAKWLSLADMYIGSFNQMPDSFVLPADHAVLRPIIESFHADPDSFLNYIQAIRNQYQPGDERVELHGLYRTILTRAIQQTRRSRIARALEVVERAINRKLDVDEKLSVAYKLEQYWARRRLEFLKHERTLTPKGKLSTDVQHERLKVFWAEVDASITRGDLPIFKLN